MIIVSKAIYLKIIKISVGGFLAFILADFLKLEYAISASVITLLTIQETKKETLIVAIRRFGSFVVAMLLATIIFNLIGYSPLTYGIFILFFCLFCFLFKFQDGLASSLVLATHIYLLNDTSLTILGNEAMIMVIGVCIGVVLNMIMQNNVEEIKSNQQRIETIMKNIFEKLAQILTNPTNSIDIDILFTKLDGLLKETKQQSFENSNNTLISDTTYYLSYVEMRKNQTFVLKHINKHISTLAIPLPQADEIALFMEEISDSFHESNNAILLLEKLETLKLQFENDELPQTRIEFEHRALLFSILNDLETLLQFKKEFIEQLSNDQIQRYLGNYVN